MSWYEMLCLSRQLRMKKRKNKYWGVLFHHSLYFPVSKGLLITASHERKFYLEQEAKLGSVYWGTDDLKK